MRGKMDAGVRLVPLREKMRSLVLTSPRLEFKTCCGNLSPCHPDTHLPCSCCREEFHAQGGALSESSTHFHFVSFLLKEWPSNSLRSLRSSLASCLTHICLRSCFTVCPHLFFGLPLFLYPTSSIKFIATLAGLSLGSWSTCPVLLLLLSDTMSDRGVSHLHF